MRQLRVWYLGETYQSHNRVGKVYKQIIAQTCSIATTPECSDVVVLHNQPWDYESLYEKLPWLRDRFVISYCTWEASLLPVEFQRSLSLVQEVWTPSTYCLGAIEPYHDAAFCVPHVIERSDRIQSLDFGIVQRLIGYDPKAFHFLSFGCTKEARKNTFALLKVFEDTADELPHARLIILGNAEYPHITSADKRVVHLPIRLSDAQVSCLYEVCDAVVSAHHCEGWGLTLSDAMLLKRPAIATEYSGNLEYMTADNSFLVPATEEFIRPDETGTFFTTDMKWGEPDRGALHAALVLVAGREGREICREKVDCANRDVARFSRDVVSQRVYERLSCISL